MSITIEELVRSIVRDELASALAGTEDDPVLDAEEAAEHAHVTVQSIHRWSSAERKKPGTGLQSIGPKGTKFLVRRSTLDAFLARRAT